MVCHLSVEEEQRERNRRRSSYPQPIGPSVPPRLRPSTGVPPLREVLNWKAPAAPVVPVAPISPLNPPPFMTYAAAAATGTAKAGM